jgi:hypothetical protein
MKKALLLSLLLIGMANTVVGTDSRSTLIKYYDVGINATITALLGYAVYTLLNTPREKPEYQADIPTLMFSAAVGYFGWRTYQSAKITQDAIENA